MRSAAALRPSQTSGAGLGCPQRAALAIRERAGTLSAGTDKEKPGAVAAGGLIFVGNAVMLRTEQNRGIP